MGMIHERPMNRSNGEAWELLNKVNYNELTMDELDIMRKVISEAQARIGHRNFSTVAVGDMVRVETGRKRANGRIPPVIYGKVTGHKRTKVVVNCGTYGSWRVPGSCLEKVDSATVQVS